MVFSSITFLFLFLPVVVAAYHLIFLPVTFDFYAHFFRKLANAWLFAASIVFYFWGENFLVVLLLTSALIDFVGGWMISGAGWSGPIEILPAGIPRTTWQRFWLIAALSGNLGLLCYYKYSGFLAANFNHLYHVLGLPDVPVFLEVLPLGISFYTFNTMSYTIDVYRGQVRATRSLLDFGCFVTMFPHLVAGPIVRYSDVEVALEHRIITRAMFARGIERFVMGLGKKVLIANTVALVADDVFRWEMVNKLSPGLAWLGLLAYALQIYFDFSGYSDMAIGIALMLGFEFRENFNYPYSARSVRDFWHRWHITLSTWFRDYVYIPLGGNRGTPFRTTLNLLLVFGACGFWHGASWNFLLWGLFHGAFLGLERLGWLSLFLRRTALAHTYTLLVVLFGWVLFRTENLEHAGLFLRALIGGNPSGISPLASKVVGRSDVWVALVLGCILSVPVFPALCSRISAWQLRLGKWNGGVELALGSIVISGLLLILLASTASLAVRSHNPFIYFRF